MNSPENSPDRHKIFVVDHDLHTVKMLTTMLETEGYMVRSADSPSEALSRMAEDLPSLVLLDLLSSEREGLDALREVNKKHPDIDVILLTGHHDEELSLEMMEMGAANYVQKPFRREDLLKVVRQTLFVRSEYDRDILSTRILVVDDDQLHLEMIKDSLAGMGDIAVSSNPVDAIGKMKARQFDILLTDIQMPEMNGLDLVRRAKLINPGIRIVVITSSPEAEFARSSMRQGVSDYIKKPFRSEDVRESVLALIDGRRRDAFDRFRRRIENQEKHEAEQFEATLNMVEVLIMALEARDPYTRGHSERVTGHSVSIGKKMGLPRQEIEVIRHSARLHDIGKIGVVDDHLYKADRLTKDEMTAMSRHPVVGSDIMKPIAYMKAFIPGVRHHHERYDGSGYPDRLRGDDIPLMARIISVADAFDAMTSSRPYRVGLTNSIAVAELERNKGVQFDPLVVDAFLKYLQVGD